jgi:hypothetical protein
MDDAVSLTGKLAIHARRTRRRHSRSAGHFSPVRLCIPCLPELDFLATCALLTPPLAALLYPFSSKPFTSASHR